MERYSTNVNERRRAATILLLIGIAFTPTMLFFSWFGEGVWLLMYGVVVPLVPFLALAAAALSPRFLRFHLYGLAGFFAIAIILGLALAAESAKAKPSDRRA